MVKIEMSMPFINKRVFGYADKPVIIRSVYMNNKGDIVFDITGEDVPDVEEVVGIITQLNNEAGEKFHRLRFETGK